ncbi:hypothetical protein [Sphingomonas sp. R86521]|uniref:hypothetical protein n=1 Tax=Sphingomonas sp. R86521 TaxID=3093860 RepID=UPI0036D3595B
MDTFVTGRPALHDLKTETRRGTAKAPNVSPASVRYGAAGRNGGLAGAAFVLVLAFMLWLRLDSYLEDHLIATIAVLLLVVVIAPLLSGRRR